ncbi:MAG: hypothetical protein OEU54_14800 [Gemmatimonadota bacterium]|nr:hypothetical protein [Gemmatimonadota bacterium]
MGRSTIVCLAAVVAGSACQGSPPMETVRTGTILREELVGTFDATAFTMTVGENVTDLLAGGASFTITLEGSAQSSGRLVAPGIGIGGADVDADLDGAWTFEPVTRTVRFSQQAETFVGDAVFRPSRTEDFSSILLATSVAGDQFLGTPGLDVVLLRR